MATVTDDARLFEVPKLRVCALKFTETARARIVKVGPGQAGLWEGTAAGNSSNSSGRIGLGGSNSREGDGGAKGLPDQHQAGR